MPDTDRINTKKALAALTAADSVGVIMLYVVPIVIGSIADAFGVREGTSGIVTSLEFGTMAAAGIFLSPIFQKLNVRRLALIGISIVLLGNFVTVFCVHGGYLKVFVALRMVVGFAEGSLLAFAYGMAARTRQPERTYSIFVGFEVAFAFLCMMCIGILIEAMGPVGAYIALVAITLLVAPAFLWFPNNRDAVQKKEKEKKTAFSSDVKMLLIGLAVFMVGCNTLYPFLERIGTALNFKASQIAIVLTVSFLFSAFGALLCYILGSRFGRAVPLALGVLIQILSVFILVYSTSFQWYAASTIVSSMALLYFIPLFNGLLAYYDCTGRATCAASGIISMATALGPLLSGLVLNAGGGYVTIAWITVALYLIMLLVGVKPAYKADKKSEQHIPRLHTTQ
ncbi:MAG: MFS transporter [Deltaproteobacteria bacterium]|nr:MFS transporter [Deltaproteobacteria bacterium]